MTSVIGQIGRKFLLCLLALVLLVSMSTPEPANAQKGSITSRNGQFYSLQEAIDQSEPGDILNVHGGQYFGSILLNKSLTLIGHDWPVLDGSDSGTVLTITAPNSVVKGFVVRNSGDNLDQENSGITIEAPRTTIEHNQFENVLFGIYLKQASSSIIRSNIIRGKALSVPRRGDLIRVWYSDDVVIHENTITGGRDLVLWYSERLVIEGNSISDGRYGLHFMYCDDATIEHNMLNKNSVGAFLMYSRRLNMRGNFITDNRGPNGYGIGLKDVDDAVVAFNIIANNRIGAALDNSPRDIDGRVEFSHNSFSFNNVGVKLNPAIRRNYYHSNNFDTNGEHVSISGGGTLRDNHWTVNGTGNFWSDYSGFDANNDGLGDIPYKAERLFEKLMDNHPELRIFQYSPSAYSIDFGARAIPMIRPAPKLVDTAPLMQQIPITNPFILPEGVNESLGIASGGMMLLLVGLLRFNKISTLRFPRKKIFPAQPFDYALSIKDLSKTFGSTRALDSVDLQIMQGETVALWGSNGAGKSTLIHCILDLISYDGSIICQGLNQVESGTAIRRLIGYVPQHLTLHDDLTVKETMQFYSDLKMVDHEEIYLNLERVALSEHSDKLIRHLSGGMKQRLALAIALISDPPILVLDEPTASLDQQSRNMFLSLIVELKKDGKTLILASHRIEDMVNLADRVFILSDGQLVRECSPFELAEMNSSMVTLRLVTNPQVVSHAAEVLRNNGFKVIEDPSAVSVDTIPDKKMLPITLLINQGIAVRDFYVHWLTDGKS